MKGKNKDVRLISAFPITPASDRNNHLIKQRKRKLGGKTNKKKIKKGKEKEKTPKIKGTICFGGT